MTLTPVLVDAATKRDHIHRKAVEGVQNVFPLQARDHNVEVENVHVKPKEYSSREQKEAILHGRTLQESLRGDVLLRNPQGKVIERQKNVTLGQIPFFTQRHTFIVDGNEYSVANQRRVRPGVYTRVRGNEELEAAFNLGKGENFRVNMDPAKGHMFLQYGSTNIPLYPVLKRMGVSDTEMSKRWGGGVVSKNREAFAKKEVQAVDKLYDRLVPPYQRTATTIESKAREIETRYRDTQLDPSVTERTLGERFKHVNPRALMRASQKILDVHREGAETDDRDSLAFQTLHSVDDFVKERIQLEGRSLARKVRMKASGGAQPELDRVLPNSPFTRSLRSFVTGSALASIPAQINPIEIIDSAVRITSLGEGGIGSERAVPDEARRLHHTHFGVIDPSRTPESFRAGIDLRASLWTKKDSEGRMHTLMRNTRTGKLEDVSVRKLEASTIAFPNETHKTRGVSALKEGQLVSVSKRDVDYELPHPAFMFSPATNTVPMPESMQGNRLLMGAKMATQALPLLEREVPHVQVASYNPGRTFEQELARLIVPHAPVSGIIKKIDRDYIYLEPSTRKKADVALDAFPEMAPIEHVILADDDEKTAASPLIKIPYDTDFPLASKTYLHNTVTVKKGDKVEANDLLAESNFTRDGRLALGRNMNVGFLAYYGMNTNDAVVVSETGANKLTSEHMYKESLPIDSDVTLDKNKHRAQFGNRWTAAQYDNLDERGVAKPGAVLHPGDPVILAIRKTAPSAEMQMLGRLHRTLATPYREQSVVWDHRNKGNVIDVVVTSQHALVTLKTQEAASIGDKVAGRYGNKGVISKVLPDDQMPRTKGGTTLDMLLPPTGVISRVNPAQIVETAVAKVAVKTGKPIVMSSMSGRNNVEWAKKLLKDNDLTDKEVLYNPSTGKDIKGPDGKGVMVGPQYTYKLFKSTETNYSARGIQDYDVNLQPSKGGSDGAKALGRMEINALLGHNARNVLHEAGSLKSSRNDEFWRAYQLGNPLPAMKASFTSDKFADMLQGAGVKVDKSNEQVRLGPMTDADITKLSSGEIKRATMIREKDFAPEKEGLFDPVVTGGTNGTRWSHVNLAEPVVNPTFEDPVRRMLGLTKSEFQRALREEGGKGVQKRLRDVDMSAYEKRLRAEVRTATGAKLDGAVKQLKAAQALKREKLSPDKAYVLSKLPVVPPVVRPILPSRGRRDLLISDANYLYRDAMLANGMLSDAKRNLPEKEVGQARQHLYDATKAVFGLGEAVSPQLQGRGAKGFITTIAGQGSPKRGFFHGKVLYKPQDLSGRGTAVPDMNLNMDEIGLPEDMLWTTYAPHIMRKMVQGGYKAVDAKKMIEDKHPAARDALMSETKKRPVFLNRAPTLHRFGLLGAYPTPVPGKTIRVNPFIEKGLNLDYDGDCALNSVLCLASIDLWSNLDYSYRCREAQMTARFKQDVGYLDGDGHFFICNLEDFPRVALENTREHTEFYSVPDGVKVVAYDEDTQRPVLASVSMWSKHKQRAIEIVTLSSGKQIITDDDPRAVYGIDKTSLLWCRRRPSEAQNQLVPVLTQLPEPMERLTCLPVPEITHARTHTLRDSIPLTQAVGYFIGLMVGDGWVSPPVHVCLACSYPEVAAAWYAAMNAFFVKPIQPSKPTPCTEGKLGNSKGTDRYTLGSVQLAQTLSPLIGHGSRNKHLPPFFYQAPKEFQLGLLGGLWDSDGSIAISNGKKKPQFMCNYSSTSIRLVQELQHLLRGLNINSTITPGKTPQGEPCWQLSLSTPDLHRFGGFPVVHHAKKALFDQFLAEPSPPTKFGGYTRNKLVPLPRALGEDLSRLITTKVHESTYVIIRRSLDKQYVTKATGQKILDVLTEHGLKCEHPQFETWTTLVTCNSTHFESVKSYEVTNQLEDGHDLTVPGYETFMSLDGVILSNTLQIHVPVTERAVDEVKGITLSNLLFGDKTKSDLLVFPQHEAIAGVHHASSVKGGKKHRFKTKQAALDAYRRGEIGLKDAVQIG